MMTPLVLCADDFGQDAFISKAILSLAQKERLSAVSCMTTCSEWARYGPLLQEFEGKLDVGLHFNLTHGHMAPYRPLSTWMLRSLTFSLNKTLVRDSLRHQLDAFEKILKRPPDFIDGHQHIHVFSGIRDVLIEVIKDRFPEKKPYVRSIVPLIPALDTPFKTFVLKGMAMGFSHLLTQHKLKHNPLFGGVYGLTAQAPYRKLFQEWLRHATPYTLLMCHPGMNHPKGESDPIYRARLNEYAYFSSDAFPQDCEKANVRLGRFMNPL